MDHDDDDNMLASKEQIENFTQPNKQPSHN